MLSLLLPVWKGDRADFLRAAFVSTVDEQTQRPDEVVIVRDGPVPAPLQECLDALVATSPVPARVLALPRNVGLGPALDAGLEACRYDLVARMDADDVSLPRRFEVQLPLMASTDLVGAGMLEIGADLGDVVGQRTPPTEPAEIARRARFADPFHHPTVLYRRARVQAVGGYGSFAVMEDYLLWAKMILDGARVGNVAEPLVGYRVGDGAYARRGGLRQLRAEAALQREFRRLGFTTPAQYARNLAVRGLYRLVPERLRRLAYRRVIANYPARA